jgi:hypothetical protein
MQTLLDQQQDKTIYASANPIFLFDTEDTYKDPY